MADCGATGSALDRVAAAAVGSVTGGGTASSTAATAAAKNVASFLGQAATTATTFPANSGPNISAAATMPLAPPTHLTLEGPVIQQQQQQQQQINTTMPSGTTKTPVVMHQQPQQQQPPAAAARAYAPHPAMIQQQQQQQMMIHQQQQHHAMMQQQQQHAMMQMQHQMMQQQMQSLQHMNATMKQQKQQQQQQKSEVEKQQAQEKQQQQQQQDEAVASNLENWHEGLEHEIQAEIATAANKIQEKAANATTTTAGHEGIVQGASMEELAQAWAEAEAMYNQENSDLHEYSSLYEPGSIEEQDVRSYQFSDAALETTKPIEPQDYMSRGMKYFNEGQMQDAILNFELELRHNDGDNPEAWRMLGRSHAENDEDRKAIACLEQAVDRDPYSPEALLALGVSYVNELNHERALENLKAWITHNPKYAGMDFADDVYGSKAPTTEGDTTATTTAFDDVQRLLLQALEYDSSDATDIQEALGVVYNVSRDYEAAISSLRTAVERRPGDYQLWNKLGATLANSSQSEEALAAYERALQLKPRYARAWLNMAISHSNLQNYDDAARCYLQTLSLNPGAGHCWSYLRIALSCSERWDLIPSAASQDLEAFRQHFDFV